MSDLLAHCRHLADTDVLIEYLRGRQPATDLLDSLAGASLTARQVALLACSTVTVTEIYVGLRPHEKPRTEALVQALICLPPTVDIAQLAGEFIQRYRSQGVALGLADALIAATAVHHDLVLVTNNPRHHPMPEIRLYEP